MSRLHHLRVIVCGVLLAGVSGCAPSISNDNTLTKRLANRGPVALSADNPFIAANLLLSREMERSPELKGFIEHRGQPTALNVERGLLGSLELTLLYADKGERYVLERSDDMWIISSPLPTVPIPPVSAQLAAKAPASESAPPGSAASAEEPPRESAAIEATAPSALLPPRIVLAERLQATATGAASTPEIVTPLPLKGDATVPDTTRAALQPGAFTSSARENPPAEKSTLAPLAPQAPTPLIRLRAEAAGHPAETTPRGDLVHHVTDPTETLHLIATWYTDGVANAPRLARINGRSSTAPLLLGDTIVVPAYLIENRNRLTDGARRELSGP